MRSCSRSGATSADRPIWKNKPTIDPGALPDYSGFVLGLQGDTLFGNIHRFLWRLFVKLRTQHSAFDKPPREQELTSKLRSIAWALSWSRILIVQRCSIILPVPGPGFRDRFLGLFVLSLVLTGSELPGPSAREFGTRLWSVHLFCRLSDQKKSPGLLRTAPVWPLGFQASAGALRQRGRPLVRKSAQKSA